MLKQPVSPTVHHPHPHPHGNQPSSASELDSFLTALTTLEPPSPRSANVGLDSLLFAAAASAGGPHMTRHHLQHSSWVRAGESRQMPRSERLRLAGLPDMGLGVGAMTPPAESVESETETEGESQTDSDADEMKDQVASPLEGPAAVFGEKEKDEASVRVRSPLSGRARTPPTPPLAPLSKRARADTGPVSAPALSSKLALLPAAATATGPPGETLPPVEVKCMARTRIPTAYGPVFLHVYHNNRDGKEHLAIVSDPAQLEPLADQHQHQNQHQHQYLAGAAEPDAEPEYVPIRSASLDAQWHAGETAQERITRGAYVSRLSGSAAQAAPVPSGPQGQLTDAPLVRIHSECFTGETLGSLRCDCGEQLDGALALIARSAGTHGHAAGRGIVLYLRQEGRGIGLLEKVRAYNLQDLGLDTVQANLALGRGADERAYDVAAAMLRDLGVGDAGVRLMTNNPAKMDALALEGISVRDRVPMVPRDWLARSASTGAAHGLASLVHSHPHAPHSPPLTAPHTPDPSTDHAHTHAAAAVGGGAGPGVSEWDMRTKGATIVGGGVVRSDELERYLRTKVERMGHLLELPRAGA